MKFTIKEIAEHFKVPLSTLKNWNCGGKDKIKVELAQLEIFIQKAKFTKEDLEFLKSLLKRDSSYELKKKAKDFEERYKKYFDKSKEKYFELAVELYSLNLTKEELKAIYKLKTKNMSEKNKEKVERKQEKKILSKSYSKIFEEDFCDPEEETCRYKF